MKTKDILNYKKRDMQLFYLIELALNKITEAEKSRFKKIWYADKFGEMCQNHFGLLSFGLIPNILEYIYTFCYELTNKEIAYIFATSHHETGGLHIPVREGFAKTNGGAIEIVTKLYEEGVIGENYAIPHSNGKSYYGRGLIQITHGDNYKRLSKFVGRDLYNDPDIALDHHVAIVILVEGMKRGLFTGIRLQDCNDFVSMRVIVNGKDRAEDIAKLADQYMTLLNRYESSL